MGEHVIHMGRGKMQAEFWWGNMRERDHLQDTGGEEGF
jgi:hypothetical protein